MRSGAAIDTTFDAVKAFMAAEVQDLELIHPEGARWAVLQFSPLPDAATRIPRLAEQLAARPDLRYAEPDFIGSGHLVPDDALYRKQWWAQKIAIEGLWSRTRGANHILLAILDSGIHVNEDSLPHFHEDLSHPRFILAHQTNNVTVSHNYVNTSLIAGNLLPKDGHGHGTHVTGIAAAAGNNFLGVAGANWVSPVYVAKVLNDNNKFAVSSVKRAVRDVMRYAPPPPLLASLFGKRIVINLSLGITYYAESLEEMCEETSNGYVAICVAAGGIPTSSTRLDWPAAFATRFKHVIAVGATDDDDNIKEPNVTDFSAITLFAPGVKIPSTTPTYSISGNFPTMTDGYGTGTGTSMACPIVAGAVSLIWSLNRFLTPMEIRNMLIDAAVTIHDNDGVRHPRINLAPFALMKKRFLPWP